MNIDRIESYAPLFEKFIIDKQYNIKKMLLNGSEVDISDPQEKNKILNTNFFKGSIAITRDSKHIGWLHPMFYASQKIHNLFHGHKNIDVNLCHGLVVLKRVKPEKGQENSHPFLFAHSVSSGIHTSVSDELTEEDVTELVVYRPLCKSLRKTIVSAAYQTAYIAKEKFRKKKSPAVHPAFSITNLIRSVFHNAKHESGSLQGPTPSNESMTSISYLIADLMLGNQFLDEQGDPKAYFCIPYSLGILQGSLIIDALKGMPRSLIEQFIKNSEGRTPNRDELSKKILNSIRVKMPLDPIAQQIWKLYWGNKLLRLNTDYLMVGYLAKKLDKLSQKQEIKSSHTIVKFEWPGPAGLEKTVRWFKSKAAFPPIVNKIIGIIATVIAVIASCGLLLPLVYYIEDLCHKIDLESSAEKFRKDMEDKLAKDPSIRPLLGRIELKSDTCAFNHVFEFTIRQGVIWQRRRDPQDLPWQPLFFDGELTGSKPVSLSADGANLVVIDDKNVVHYRKILSEGRGYKDIYRSPSLRRHLKSYPEIKIHKQDTDSYFAVDKIDKPYWYRSWYNFPCVKRIVNFLSGPHLVSKGIISHLGKYSLGYSDADGKFHLNPVGVTTLYEKSLCGLYVCKFDPWAPKWSKVLIPFPKTDMTCFMAQIIDASASTIMSLGYEFNKKTQKMTLKIITKLCDIDTMGGNPFFSYAHQTENVAHPHIRTLQDRVENEGWKVHSLPQDIAEFYSQISIIQTGPGNDAYELRVAVKTLKGEIGYYSKPDLKADTSWEFIPYEHVDTSVKLAPIKNLDLQELAKIPFTPRYRGQTQDMEVELLNFDEHAYHSQLKISLNGKSYDLYLHKRLGWRTFLGYKHEKYTLVIPEDQVDETFLNKFEGRRTFPVCISVKPTSGKNVVNIKSQYLNCDVVFNRRFC